MNNKKKNTKTKNNTIKTGNINKTVVISIIVFIISISIGFAIGRGERVNSQIKSSNATSSTSIDDSEEQILKNYQYILNNYYQDIDEETLVKGAIKGMTEILGDDYSTYIEAEEGTNFNATLDGNYKGLGIEIIKDEQSGGIKVTGLFKDAPAFKAGIQLGDIIIKVDGEDIDDLSASEFSYNIIMSEKDTFVLTVLRDGKEKEFSITKDYVEIESVTSEVYEKNDKKIGYIYISTFAANTSIQFRKELTSLESQGIDSLIIDVRSDGGGYLTAAESILDIFLTKKQIAYQMKSGNKITKTYGSAKSNKDYPIALLADGNSASASEILVSGLKENLNCTLIGTKTYGKGTVQELVSLSNGDQYKITTKKWLTPNGNWVNDTEGIEPDIEVELSEKYFKTYESKDDNQLQKAIEYLSTK